MKIFNVELHTAMQLGSSIFIADFGLIFNSFA